MTTTTLATPARDRWIPLQLDERRAYQVDRTVVSIHRTRPEIFHVEVYTGFRREDDLCASYAAEDHARAVARLYCQLYRLEATP